LQMVELNRLITYDLIFMKTEQTQISELLFEFFSFIAALAAFAYKAYAVMLYWKWFISDITNLPLIGFVQSIGIVFFTVLLRGTRAKAAGNNNDLIVKTFVNVTIIILIGLALKSI